MHLSAMVLSSFLRIQKIEYKNHTLYYKHQITTLTSETIDLTLVGKPMETSTNIKPKDTLSFDDSSFRPDLQIIKELNRSLNTEFDEKVHLRVFKRNARKCITTIENLPTDADIKKLLKKFKQSMNCSGSIDTDEQTKKPIMSLQGDHRALVKDYLINNKLVTEGNVVVHGF